MIPQGSIMSFQVRRVHHRQTLFIPRNQNEEGDIFSNDDMELSPAAQREIDLIMERQNKRARG